MKRPLSLLIYFTFFSLSAFAQDLYFPPLEGDEWETLDYQSLGWCTENVDTLLSFVEAKNSKSFIVLVDGKIVIEEYFDGYEQDSTWYWASASKSLLATLIGIAQEDGHLNIADPTSDYLGTGWTNCSLEAESQVLIQHQLSMASGLDDGLEPTGSTQNCFDSSCFECLAAPTTRWAYHNSAYRILQDVLENTTGQNKNIFTWTRLGNRIGMGGLWFNYVYYSTARNMARFGLFTLAKGNWNGDPIFSDQNYYTAMTNSSQAVNPAYGYLWWLNGKSSYMLPGLQFSFDGALIPEAPSDLIAALGKNDQKIYVVPSKNMVVIRQGDSAGSVLFAASSFDNQLWERMGNLECTTSNNNILQQKLKVFPNPGNTQLTIQFEQAIPSFHLQLIDLNGQILFQQSGQEHLTNQLQIDHKLGAGLYFYQLQTNDGVYKGKFFVER